MSVCMFVCLFVEGLSRDYATFRGWSQLSRELRFSERRVGIRELCTLVGTYADDPSQTGIKSALLEIDAGLIAATQRPPRLLAPARQLGCRRDQRLLPRRVDEPIVPASHRPGSRLFATPFRGQCKPGIQLSAWHTAPPNISLRAVTTQAIRLAYGTALSRCAVDFRFLGIG